MTGLLLGVLKELLRRLLLKADPLLPLSWLKMRHESYLAAQLKAQAAKQGRGVSSRDCGWIPKPKGSLPLVRKAELKFGLWLWGGLIK